MLRQLIVNADDFGATVGVSRGILTAHLEGIVTSTTVLINLPDAATWLPIALRDAPDLGIGLHLNLTKGCPVSAPDEIPDLVGPDGVFLNQQAMIAALPTVDITQVEKELRAQTTRFVEIAGRTPDHLDSHHHITYLSPPMVALMAQLAHELEVPVRRPLPEANSAQSSHLIDQLSEAVSPAYAEEMMRTLEGILKKGGIRTPERFIATFFGEKAILGELLLLLLDLQEGTSELMCHPGEVDDALRESSDYAEKRGDELAALTHVSAREVIQSEFIQLITFGDLTDQ